MSTRIIRFDELSRMTGLSRSSIWRQEKRGTFPLRRRIGDNAVGWLLDEVNAWARSRDVVVMGRGHAPDDETDDETKGDR